MNEIMQQMDLLKETLAIKSKILDCLNESDLGFELGGNNLSLGGLCKEMGDIQQIYIDSFTSLKMDWGYKYRDETVLKSLDALKTWHKQLDEKLIATLEAIKDEDVTTKLIDRGGFMPPLGVQFHIFREGLLIFGGKAVIYLKALNKSLPEQVHQWIG